MLTIGKVAKASGLAVETLRYYEKEGLLPSPARSPSGYRLYQQDSISRLNFISRAKTLGFSLAEIRKLLFLADGGGSPAEVKALTQDKLAMVTEKIADLQRIAHALQELSDSCQGAGCISACPIIETLNDSD